MYSVDVLDVPEERECLRMFKAFERDRGVDKIRTCIIEDVKGTRIETQLIKSLNFYVF